MVSRVAWTALHVAPFSPWRPVKVKTWSIFLLQNLCIYTFPKLSQWVHDIFFLIANRSLTKNQCYIHILGWDTAKAEMTLYLTVSHSTFELCGFHQAALSIMLGLCRSESHGAVCWGSIPPSSSVLLQFRFGLCACGDVSIHRNADVLEASTGAPSTYAWSRY